MAGCCEQCHEPSDSVKCGDFYEYLLNCWLLKMKFVWWSELVSLSEVKERKRGMICRSVNDGF